MVWEEVNGKWESIGDKSVKKMGLRVCEPTGRKRNLGDLTSEQIAALVQRQKQLFSKKKDGGLDIDEDYNCYYFKKSLSDYRKEVIWAYLGLGDFAEDCHEDFSIGCETFDWNDKYVKDKQKSIDEDWEEVAQYN